jgi:hypothetical protein
MTIDVTWSRKIAKRGVYKVYAKVAKLRVYTGRVTDIV